MTDTKVIMAAVFTFFLLIIVIGMLLSYPVMLLWNGCIVGTISGIGEIGWLQAWGILILCGILFKPLTSSKN